MPSKKGPCPCSNCHGATCAASTIKKHMAIEVERNNAQASLSAIAAQNWNNAHRVAISVDDEYEGSDEGAENGGSDGHNSADEGHGAKQITKCCRVHSPELEEHTKDCFLERTNTSTNLPLVYCTSNHIYDVRFITY